MRSSPIDLKNPIVAAVLAYLLPGAGHFYQGRFFKGALYSTCILGTFFWGMHLGEWKCVYFRMEPGAGRHRTMGYFAQAMVGLPAVTALVQAKRYEPPRLDHRNPEEQFEKLRSLDQPITTTFEGRIISLGRQTDPLVGTVSGQIELHPVAGGEVVGTFSGVLNGQTPISLTLAGPIEIGPRVCGCEDVSYRLLTDTHTPERPVFASHRRYLQCQFTQSDVRPDVSAGYIEGTVPRPLWDWFQVPLEIDALQDVHGRLGKQFEIALVFTWIAGLLNLLAVWDAAEGPAYETGRQQTESNMPTSTDESPPESELSATSETMNSESDSPRPSDAARPSAPDSASD